MENMQFNAIKNCISIWKDMSNQTTGYNLLSTGSIVEIKESDYSNVMQLTSKSTSVHLYIGADPSQEKLTPVFFVIGSEYDTCDIALNQSKILIVRFKNPVKTPDPIQIGKLIPKIDPSNISTQEALKRSFIWTTFKTNWFQDNSVNSTVVRAFKIPRDNFTEIYGTGAASVLLFFGIKEPKTDRKKHVIDLILANSETMEFSISNVFKNVTTPCPPYPDEGLYLLP